MCRFACGPLCCYRTRFNLHPTQPNPTEPNRANRDSTHPYRPNPYTDQSQPSTQTLPVFAFCWRSRVTKKTTETRHRHRIHERFHSLHYVHNCDCIISVMFSCSRREMSSLNLPTQSDPMHTC